MTFQMRSAVKVITVVMALVVLSGCDVRSRMQYGALVSRAEAGNADAQIKLARTLDCPNVGCAWGPWFPKCDDARCFALLTRAAEQNNAEAQFMIGDSYSHQGSALCHPDKDVDKAMSWYLKAVAQQHKGAAYRLAEIYKSQGQLAEAAKWQELGGTTPPVMTLDGF